MSGLCTFKSSCPFFTLSSRRALMSTTRPLASEMTGTSREMSGKTAPVAVSSDGRLDLARPWMRGNLLTSLLSMVIRFMSGTWMTCAGGGAPSPLRLALLQPESSRHERWQPKQEPVKPRDWCLSQIFDIIELPRVLRQDSVVRRRSDTSRSVADRPVARSGSRSAR